VQISAEAEQGEAEQGEDFSFEATADFGNSASPGLKFNWSGDGEIEEFDLGISGDFMLGGLKVQAKDLAVAYDSSTDVLAIGGSVSLARRVTPSPPAWSPRRRPRLDDRPHHGQVDFDGLQLSLSNFNLGAFSINNAS
jgi:hypothetical protein